MLTVQEKLRRLDWQSKNSVVSGQETGEKNEPPRHEDTKTQRQTNSSDKNSTEQVRRMM